jgi:large subunit ribosomal protein L24
MKIKVGDEVKVTIGKDKGKTGKVEKVFPKIGKILVANINVYKKHTKAKAKYPAGIIEKAIPLYISKVGLICPNCKKITRVGFKQDLKNKFRICRKCKKVIEV